MIQRSSLITALVIVSTSLLIAQRIGPREVGALPSSKPTATDKYGDDPLQFGELRLPKGTGPFAIAVVIHGGCWTKGFATLRNTAPMASALVEKGVATWNIEYRQVEDPGGGWPGTFRDWGSATDHLRMLAKSYPLDLSRIVVLGHSAGAHAALWVAARKKLPVTSEIRGTDPIAVQAAVAIDGPGDLPGSIDFLSKVCGKPVIESLMGGTPTEQPERYRQASPQSLLPLGVPQYLIAAPVLTLDKAREYQKLAREKGDQVEILAPPGAGHFDIIAPGHEAWKVVEEFILRGALK
jgi:acetyl esterase/lipase